MTVVIAKANVAAISIMIALRMSISWGLAQSAVLAVMLPAVL